MKQIHNIWLSPFIAIAFTIVVLTGLLMFFHIGHGYLKNVHEWIGLLFGVAAALHLLLNWRLFTSYFKQRRALVSMASVVLLATLCLLGGKNDSHERGLQHSHPPYGLEQQDLRR